MVTDAVLVDRVIAGFDDAFDELYRRHANAAWRVAQAVTGNSHDAADAVSEAFARVLQAVRTGKLADGDAFRAYLITATRNAGLDGLRRQGKVQPAEDLGVDAPAPAPGPADSLAGAEDADIVVDAFRNLPERWRSVLWLTEVEGMATKDAATHLGLSANGTAQLAVRARAGLRDRYLQAHVRNHARPECRFTVEHLGAYVGGGLAPRDLAKVDQHLAGCADCRARKEELEDLGSTLRRIVLPVPLALGAMSAGKVHAVLTASNAAPTFPSFSAFTERAVQLAKEPTPFMKKAVGASAAGVLALGLLSLGFVGDGGDDRVAGLSAPRTNAAPASVEAPLATLDGDALIRRFGSISRPAPRTAAVAPTPTGQAPRPAPTKVSAKPATRQPAKPQSKPDTRKDSPVVPALPVDPCTLPVVNSLLCGPAGDSPEPTAPTAEVVVNVPEVGPVGVAVDLGGETPGVGITTPLAPVGEPQPAPSDQPVTVRVNGDSLLP